MAKRTRYPGRTTARRPGGGSRPGGGGSAAATRSAGLTAAELERAAALEAEVVAREKAAQAETERRRARGRTEIAARPPVGASGEPLSVRASHEYAYVARDVRRIVATAALMFGVLALLWVLVNVAGVVRL